MLKLSKITDYGLVVISYLAGCGAELVSARDIALQVRIGLPTVSKVLKLLVGAGLVKSLRGVQGGYQIARSPASISVVDVIAALEGPLGLTECSTAMGCCAQESVCALRSNWQRVNQLVLDVLEQFTLAEMCQPLPSQHRAFKNIHVETVAC